MLLYPARVSSPSRTFITTMSNTMKSFTSCGILTPTTTALLACVNPDIDHAQGDCSLAPAVIFMRDDCTERIRRMDSWSCHGYGLEDHESCPSCGSYKDNKNVSPKVKVCLILGLRFRRLDCEDINKDPVIIGKLSCPIYTVDVVTLPILVRNYHHISPIYRTQYLPTRLMVPAGNSR